MTNRLPFCAAAARTINGRAGCCCIFEQKRQRSEKQRRFNILYDNNAVLQTRGKQNKFCKYMACKEVKKPLVSSGSFAHFSSRCVKKTCRWHVFSADLGGYAAVAAIWISNALRKNGLPRRAYARLAMTETGRGRAPPLRKS